MDHDNARAVLLAAYVAHPDLPTDIRQALAKLIIPKRKKRWFSR